MKVKEKEQLLKWVNDPCIDIQALMEKINSLPTDPEPEQKRKFSVGAKVRIIANKHGHKFNIGDIVTIVSHDESGIPDWLCKKDRYCQRWISDEEGELVIDEQTKPTKISELTDKDVIWCKTKEESNRISVLLNKEGKTWLTGKRYTNLSNWMHYKKQYCINPNTGQCAGKKYYKGLGKNIIPSTQITGV